MSVNIYFKLFISLLIVSRYLYTQFSDDKTLYEQPLWTVRLFTEKILTEKIFYNGFCKNVLNKQLGCYRFAVCKVEPIFMSTLTSSLRLFNRFFVEKMMQGIACNFWKLENNFVLCEMPQWKFILTFSFFLHHLKLETFVEFLFDSCLEEYP